MPTVTCHWKLVFVIQQQLTDTLALKVLVSQSCLTLGNPVDCSPPGSSAHGILQARILEWAAIFFSRISSQPRDQTQVSCIAGRLFTIWATREALTLKALPNQTTVYIYNIICYFSSTHIFCPSKVDQALGPRPILLSHVHVFIWFKSYYQHQSVSTCQNPTHPFKCHLTCCLPWELFPNNNFMDVNHPRFTQAWLSPHPQSYSPVLHPSKTDLSNTSSCFYGHKAQINTATTTDQQALTGNHYVCALDRLDPLRLWPPQQSLRAG